MTNQPDITTFSLGVVAGANLALTLQLRQTKLGRQRRYWMSADLTQESTPTSWIGPTASLAGVGLLLIISITAAYGL